MSQIQIPDQIYGQAKIRAKEAGIASVDDYVVDLLANEGSNGTPRLDHLFTLERIALLDQISAEVKAGSATLSSEQVREHFRVKSQAWPKNSAS